jgi:alpha-ribazole phosphatase
MGYHVGGLTVGCHAHGGPLDLRQSVAQSCNAYYCNVFRRIIDNSKYRSVKEGLDAWKVYANNFGLGKRMGIDFDTELKGSIPGQEYFNKVYNGSWNSVTIISLSIGQGEVLSTPIQSANLASACGYSNPILENRLKEMNMGDWEMRLYDDIAKEDPHILDWYNDYMHLKATGGESFPILYQRVADFLDELKDKSYKNVAIFAHGGVLICAGIYGKLFKKENAFENLIDYGGIETIEI